MDVKVNRRRTYEVKCVSRLKVMAESMDIIVHGTRWGTRGTNRCCCVFIDPRVPAEKVRELSQRAQKCFRKASVEMGHGASRPYSPEIVFHTIYLIFYGANHD